MKEEKSEKLDINKGVELLLRSRRKSTAEPKTFEFSFDKIVCLFQREIKVCLNFSFNIKRSNSQR